MAAAEASPDVSFAERAAQFTFGAGFDAHAEQSAARWIALAPDNPLPHELMGRLKLRRHAVDEAVQSFLAALGPGEPRRDDIYLALASDLANEPDAALVTRTLSRLAALDPLAAGLQLALGTAALRSGDYELAMGAAATAAWMTRAGSSRSAMARGIAGAGRKDEALALESSLSRDDPHPLVQLEQARMMSDAGKLAPAREALADLTVLFGERPEITRTLAFLDLAGGDLAAADERFDELDDGGSDRFESFYYRGQIASQRDDAEGARRYFARISSGPYLVPAQLAIAESLFRTDEGHRPSTSHAFGFDHPAQAYDVLEYKAQILQALIAPKKRSRCIASTRLQPTAIPILLSRGGLLEQQGRVPAALPTSARRRIAPDDALALNATATSWRIAPGTPTRPGPTSAGL